MSFLRSLRRRCAGSRPRHAHPQRIRLFVESLEERTLPSTAGILAPGGTSYPNASLQSIGELMVNPGEHSFYTGVIDTLHGYAYFGTTGPGPASIVKVALGSNGALPTRVGSLVLPAGEDHVLSSVIDPANGYAYFGASDGIIKVALGNGNAPPTRVGLLPLIAGEGQLFCAAADTANGYAYFGATTGGVAEVIKVALGQGNALPTRVGSALLPAGGEWRAMIDPADGYLYVADGFNTPAHVTKLALGQGNAPPTVVGALTLNAADGPMGAAGIDVANGYLYLASYQVNQNDPNPGTFVKVALGAGNAAPTEVGAINLPAKYFTTMLVDPAAGYAYISNDLTLPASNVIKVSLGQGNALPSVAGNITLRVGSNPPVVPATAFEPQAGDMYVRSGVFDPGTGYAYFATDSQPSLVIKVLVSEMGAVHATKVVLNETANVTSLSFYSHAATGNLRLAIYDNGSPKNLLWDSGPIADSVTNGWVTVPVPAGLTLAPGTYWLAYQTNSAADVADYTAGAPGDGFSLLQDFGTSPATISGEQSTADRWGMYLTYDPVSSGGAPPPPPPGPGSGGASPPAPVSTGAAPPAPAPVSPATPSGATPGSTLLRAPIRVTGADAGGGPLVNVYDAATGTLLTAFYAFPATFTGGVRVAVGDVTGDGVPDIIVGAGPGGGPEVRVFDGQTFQMVRDFQALPVQFTGGVFVAAGDVNNDGFTDIITSADAGGGPQVTITSGKDGSQLSSFYATAATFTGGIRVATGDINGDGFADVIAVAGPGGGPQVTIFDGQGLRLLTAFYALVPSFTGGLYVAAGDVTGDGRADIIAGADRGGGPQVTVFDGATLTERASFYALPATFTGGVRVGFTSDFAGRPGIVTVAGPGGGPQATVYDGLTLAVLDSFFTFAPTFRGGVFVAGN